MNESQEYTLRWRGRQIGPFTIQEINRKLDEHEIGMGHEIHYENKWINVEEFLLALKSGAAGSQPAASLAQRTVRPVGPEPADAVSATAEGVMSWHSKSSSKAPMRPEVPKPQENASGTSNPATTRPRNRLIYAMLALLLGFFGVHNFYARHWLTGLFQLVLSSTTFLLGFGIIATWIWALVEAVVIRKDGYGTKMC